MEPDICLVYDPGRDKQHCHTIEECRKDLKAIKTKCLFLCRRSHGKYNGKEGDS